MLVEELPITEIRPYKKNPRRNDDGVDAVAASLQEFGWRQPIVVDETGVIIVGHTRSKASALAVRCLHSLSPWGLPNVTLPRRATISGSVCASATWLNQSSGSGSGPGCRGTAGSSHSPDGKIDGIVGAAKLAMKHPIATNEILSATRQFCDSVPLTNDAIAKVMAFSLEISNICAIAGQHR